MVLKENQELGDDFKKSSQYKIGRTDHDAFAAIEVEALEGDGKEVEEDLQLYLDDLEDDDSGEED